MGQDTILIVDSLNYIKGFRYQMYCAAREMKIRVCTVSVSPSSSVRSLTLLDEVDLRRDQTRAVSRMELGPRGGEYEVLCGNVRP